MPELPEVETVRRAIAPRSRVARSSGEIYDPRLTRPFDPAAVAAELPASASVRSTAAAST